MLTVTKTFTFDCAHRLKKHKGLCKNIHGHTYKVDVTMSGPLQKEGAEDGMILDFKRLKEIANKIFGAYDHAYICDVEDKEVLEFMQAQDFKVVEFPGAPTAERMAIMFHELLDDAFGDTHINIERVDVWETPTSFATYTG